MCSSTLDYTNTKTYANTLKIHPSASEKAIVERRFVARKNIALSFSALPNNEPASNQFQLPSEAFGNCSTSPNATIKLKAARKSLS